MRDSKGRFVKGYKPENGGFPKGIIPWNKGRKCPEISALKKGKKRPIEMVKKMSETKKRLFRDGKLHPWNEGKHFTEEQKNTIAEATKIAMKIVMSDPIKSEKIRVGQRKGHITNSLKKPWEHPNWQGGKSYEPYPLGWTKTFREQIRQRDNYRCRMCGVPEIECNKKLHVHHVDCDKKNLTLSNLITLCNRCHMKIHRKMIAEKAELEARVSELNTKIASK